VLGLTMTPKSPSARAILWVVRWDHFSPVIGSPAVSYSSRNSIRMTMSAVFFDPFASAAGTASAPHCCLLIEQLLTSAGDGVGIQAEEFGQNGIAAVSQLDGLRTGEQATLLFVEQAVEKQNGGFKFIRRYLEGGSIGHQRNRLRSLPGAKLIPSLPTIGGSVEEASGHLRAAQAFGAHQIMKGILDLGMERVGQFIGEPAARGLMDEGLDGSKQSAVAGKPNCIMGPQAGVVEAGGFAKGIVAAAMGITGQVIQELKLAKDGEVDRGAENAFELGQSHDFMVKPVLAEGLGIETEWSHNVIVPTSRVFQSEL
jgi:hypothetical protein